MRVDSSNAPGVAQQLTSNRGEGKTRGEQTDDSKSAVVVSIGEAAKGSAEAAARLDSEVKTRLEAVRLQLQNSNYPIDFDRLAERIVEDELARAGL